MKYFDAERSEAKKFQQMFWCEIMVIKRLQNTKIKGKLAKK